MPRKRKTTTIPTAQTQSTPTPPTAEQSDGTSGQPEKGMASEQQQKKEVTVNELIDAVFSGLGPNATDDQKKARDDAFGMFLQQVLARHPICAKYNLLVLHDEGRMVQSDADNIYNAVTKFPQEKPI